MTTKIPCVKCKAEILPSTAERTGGLCMACKQGIRESIEASRLYYQKIKEYDPFREYWKYLVKKVYGTDNNFRCLSENEKTVFSVKTLIDEVFNGGFDQYFFNHSGEYYNFTRQGLKTINATTILELLEKAKKLIFNDMDYPEETSTRRDILRRIEDSDHKKWELIQNELGKLDSILCKDEELIEGKLNDFITKHQLLKPFEYNS